MFSIALIHDNNVVSEPSSPVIIRSPLRAITRDEEFGTTDSPVSSALYISCGKLLTEVSSNTSSNCLRFYWRFIKGLGC